MMIQLTLLLSTRKILNYIVAISYNDVKNTTYHIKSSFCRISANRVPLESWFYACSNTDCRNMPIEPFDFIWRSILLYKFWSCFLMCLQSWKCFFCNYDSSFVMVGILFLSLKFWLIMVIFYLAVVVVLEIYFLSVLSFIPVNNWFSSSGNIRILMILYYDSPMTVKNLENLFHRIILTLYMP
jgi:hypothetical protein